MNPSSKKILYYILTSIDMLGFIFIFNRKQIVHDVVRGKPGEKHIEKDDFIDDWSVDERLEIESQLKDIIIHNGIVVTANKDERVVGLASIDYKHIGPNQEYCQLSEIHVEEQERRKGIGKVIFEKCCDKAKGKGIRKLYISSHSAKETVAFYRAMGCVDAKWINEKQVTKEPCDYQLEYIIK